MPSPVLPGGEFPQFSWPTTGSGSLDLANEEGWRLLIVYRGKHCPLCKRYLDQLNEMLGDFRESGIFVAALSADPKDKAEAQVSEHGWDFQIGYDLRVEQMQHLGLYVSNPRSPEETDRPFSEPGVFVLNPEGQVQIVDVSNAPFSRPDLRSLFDGLQFVAQNDYPIRGTA